MRNKGNQNVQYFGFPLMDLSGELLITDMRLARHSNHMPRRLFS